MDDSIVMSGLQRFRNLSGNVQGLLHGNRTFRNSFRESRPVYQFHDEEVRTDIEEAADIVVIQRGDEPCFALEPLIEALRRDFDRHVASQALISRAIHFAHST